MGTWDKTLDELKTKLSDETLDEWQKPSLVEEFVNELTVNQFSSMLIDMREYGEDREEKEELDGIDQSFNEGVDVMTEFLTILLESGRI